MDQGAENYRRFLEGDEGGFVELVRCYKDGLILYLNSIVHNLSLAEELAEDTFVRLGVRRPRNRGKASFKTWLYTIGRNVAIDSLRRRRSVSLADCGELEGGEDLERSYLRQERNLLLYRAMGQLSPDYRQILWLVYFDGFSCREAAKIMGRTAHGGETLIYRARRALGEELRKEGYDHEDL